MKINATTLLPLLLATSAFADDAVEPRPNIITMSRPTPMNELREIQYAADMEAARLEAERDGHAFMAPKIVNGVEVSPQNKYPYATYAYGCGASLVAPNVLLCAAHCQGFISQVKIGCHDKNQSPGGTCEVHQVAEEVPHPQYNGQTLDNDFMMIRLATSSSHPTVALHNGSVNAGEDLIVMGWGTLSSGGSTSNVLMEVEVDALSNTECNSKYSNQITNNMICAARSNGTTHYDSCQGDSGGPIIMKSTGAQVGVVSWGIGCANPNYPGVYARVSAKYDWIQGYINQWSGAAPPPGTPPPPPPSGGTCTNWAGWTDSYGDGCEWYEANDSAGCPNWTGCCDAGNGTPDQACCHCGGGDTSSTPPPPNPTPSPPPPPGTCQDKEGWVDEFGDACDWYDSDKPGICSTFGNTPGSDGLNAAQACCACGGGSSGSTPTPPPPPASSAPSSAPVTTPPPPPPPPPTPTPPSPTPEIDESIILLNNAETILNDYQNSL
jgi:trypsin